MTKPNNSKKTKIIGDWAKKQGHDKKGFDLFMANEALDTAMTKLGEIEQDTLHRIVEISKKYGDKLPLEVRDNSTIYLMMTFVSSFCLTIDRVAKAPAGTFLKDTLDSGANAFELIDKLDGVKPS